MSAKSNLSLDILLAAGFLAASNPPLTGPAAHEWLGVVYGAAIVLHLLFHWDWLACATRRLFESRGRASRLDYAVDGLLLVSFTAAVLSGLMISRHVLAALGLATTPARAWREVHSLAANISLAALGVHVGLHWTWVSFHASRLLGIKASGSTRASERVERPGEPSFAPDGAR